MKLILTRHGETIENIKNIMMGHLPGKLTKKGIQQSKKLAKRLAKEKIDFIYSSDLARAVDTAKEIHKYHPNVPIKFVKDLREMFYGDLQGKVCNDFNINKLPKNSESREYLHKRAKEFIEKMLKRHKDDTVLVVCHGGIGHALVCALTGKPSNSINIADLKNTSVSVFEIEEEKNHKIHVYNCIKHLDQMI